MDIDNNVRCPICGEEYNKSYSACPFCAESGPFEGTVKRRRPAGRRVEKRRGPKIVGPAMIVVLLLLAAVLVYAFFGDKIKAKLFPEPVEPPVVDEQITLKPTELELNVGEIQTLDASGAKAYIWSSSDPAVAAVDESGKVTAVGAGNATITVKDKDGKLPEARCDVTVREPGTVEPGPDEPGPVNPGPDEPGPVNPGPDEPGTDPEKKLVMGALERGNTPLDTIPENGKDIYDVTLYMGKTVHLKIIGTDSKAVWSSDSSAVTVTEEGTITRIGSGTAYITAVVDGQTLICKVR